jgi:hypothetical protein
MKGCLLVFRSIINDWKGLSKGIYKSLLEEGKALLQLFWGTQNYFALFHLYFNDSFSELIVTCT